MSTKLISEVAAVIKLDPWLEPFADALRRRYVKASQWINTIDAHEGGLENFSRVS